ncbi:zinc finger protein 16-like isoform X2 [Pararge aegeria]|uniref:zinc finger protein 16-like isoform X2 n=1 Tax=Pararge aegeria TaxID=116150 RepID=UPI0019D138B2|nr:zinc finger protein 16-like isoform X2 [Pararge aegeria]
MALCESQLQSAMHINGAESTDEQPSPDKKREPNGDIYVPPLPLSVDYRSPVSHFVPPAVELYAARHKPEINVAAAASNETPTPVKRKRGRPRIDKTSPEYLANMAARKQAKEMAAVMNNRPDTGEKRKRGRPRVDKTSPEYLARKRAREMALEKKAKREYRRRATGAKIVKMSSVKAPNTASSTSSSRVVKLNTANKMVTLRNIPQKIGTVRKAGDKNIIMRRNAKFFKRKDSAASSSAGESTPRVKRKYTKRTPNAKKDSVANPERVKGKRGRPRKNVDPRQPQQAKIRVRSNLMPLNAEPIPVDSDEEPDLGSPSQASDSLSLDENLRALRHIHEKYANIDKDDLYGAHLLAAQFKKPPMDQVQRLNRDESDEVLSIRSSEGGASVKELDAHVEKLEDSSNSDSGSSSSGSGSSSSSSSSSSSGSSSSSDSSDSDSDDDANQKNPDPPTIANPEEDSTSFGAWSYGPQSGDSDSDPERAAPAPAPAQDELSESENESADKSFQCHVCRKWYSTRVTLKIHRRSHLNKGGGSSNSRSRSSDRYECDCCNETFNRREKLFEHKAEAHRGAMTVRCEVCRKCFEDDAELAAHDRTHTADERAGRCSECGSSFGRYEQLRRHRASAHASSAPSRLPHVCAQCGKRFTHTHSLTRHIHNHAKQLYRCVVCKASFTSAEQLAQHLNSHLVKYKRLQQ